MTQTPLMSRHQLAINAMVEKACGQSCYSQDARSNARARLLAVLSETPRQSTRKRQLLKTLADSLNADVWRFL